MTRRGRETLTQRLVRSGSTAGELSRTSPAVRLAAVRSLFDYGACLGAPVLAYPAWPASRAARLAVAAHAADRDDLHYQTLAHPGGVIWSTVAALAVDESASFGAALEAATVGYETVVRLARALGVGHRSSWHVTSTTGMVGAAAAGAALLALDEAAAADAVGHALSLAGGSAQALVERSRTRLIHRAHAADVGVACARAAGAGLTATRFGLEAQRGLLAVMSPTPDPDALDTPSDRTGIEETGFRLHATNGFAQGAVDAAAQLALLRPS